MAPTTLPEVFRSTIVATTAATTTATTAQRTAGALSRWAQLSQWVLGLAVAVWVFPPFVMDVGNGLDPSWGVGLHMARHHHLRFGTDIIYTFGPLGFLVQPVIAYPGQGLVAGWLRIPLFAFVGWFLISRLRLAMPWWAATVVAIPLTWAVVAPQGFGGDAPGVVLVVALAAGVVRLTTDHCQLSHRVTALLAVAVVLSALIKVDVGIVGAVALLLYVVGAGIADDDTPPQTGTLVLITVVMLIAGLVVMWVLLGQPLGSLGPWVRSSMDVVLGHNAAMGADNGRGWWAPATVAATVAVSALLVAATWTLPWRRRAVAFVFTASMVALAVKQAFLRSDSGHMQRLLALFIVLGVVLASRRASSRTSLRALAVSMPLAVALCGAMVVMALSVNAVAGVPFANPVKGVRSVRYLMDMTTSQSRRTALVAWGHTAQPTVMKVPPTMIKRIGNKSVHIEPWDASVAWVYRLKWHPLPVFQSYMAYTPRLDQLNADALASPSAPQTILHQSLALDGRIPRFQSPAANVEMLCRYSMVEFGSDWNLFVRTASSRCGKGRPLGSFSAKQGTPVVVPVSAGDQMVVARFEGLDPGLMGTMRALLLRPRPMVFRVGTDPVAHRFIVATQNSAHIIRVPQCLQGRLGSYDTSSYDTFTLSTSRSLPAPGGPRYTVRFEAIPYRCP